MTDLPGAEERDEAIAASYDASPDDWKQRAHEAVVHLARTRSEFTTDDVWAIVGQPPEPRAMGGVMQKAQGAGLIRRTERTRNSNRAVCHRSPKRVWESCLTAKRPREVVVRGGRGTGKTTRMLRAAIGGATATGCAYVVALPTQFEMLRRMVMGMVTVTAATGPRLVLEGGGNIIFIKPGALEIDTQRGVHLGSSFPVFGDHYALEAHMGWALKELSRYDWAGGAP